MQRSKPTNEALSLPVLPLRGFFALPQPCRPALAASQASTRHTWQGSEPYSYLPYAADKRIVVNGRFALGEGLPPAFEWIWSKMEYPRDGLILEALEGS
jgi:hypothetical protein